VVKALAGSDRVKVEVIQAGGVENVIDAIRRHQRSAAVCEAGCAAIAALVLRFPTHCDAVITAGGHEVICTTLELHDSAAAVQVHCTCDVICHMSRVGPRSWRIGPIRVLAGKRPQTVRSFQQSYASTMAFMWFYGSS